MGRPLKGVKGSCLWRVGRAQLPCDEICEGCKSVAGKDVPKLIEEGINCERSCHVLTNALVNADAIDSSEDARTRSATDFFVGGPANGSVMRCVRERNEPRSRERKRKPSRARHLAARAKKKLARRRSFLAAVAGDDTLNVPRDGKSKAAASKQKKTLGMVARGSLAILFPDADDKNHVAKLEAMRDGLAHEIVKAQGTAKEEPRKRPAVDNATNETKKKKATTSIAAHESLAKAPAFQKTALSSSSSVPFAEMMTTKESRMSNAARMPFAEVSSALPSDGAPMAPRRKRHDAVLPRRCGQNDRVVGCCMPSAAFGTGTCLPCDMTNNQNDSSISQQERSTEIQAEASADDAADEIPAGLDEPTQDDGHCTDAATDDEIERSWRQRLHAKMQQKQAKRKSAVDAVVAAIGPVMMEELKQRDAPEDRRPMLAAVVGAAGKSHAKKAVETASGLKMSADEWTAAKMHARHPGKFCPVEKQETNRCRIPHRILKKLLQFLESPGNTQRCAFGTRMQKLLNDQETCELDRISLTKKLMTVAAEFISETSGEFDSQLHGVIPEDAERCTKMCTHSNARRCMHNGNHDGKCEFTPKGSTCFRTAMELVRSLATDDIKRLAGLDDVKVLKGRDDWESLRKMSKKLFTEDDDKLKSMLERIDEQEVHCNADCIPHLERESSNGCNCLSCGFACEDENITCTKHCSCCASCANNQQQSLPCTQCVNGCMMNDAPPCKKCVEGFEIMNETELALAEQESRFARDTPSVLQLQKLDEIKFSLVNCRRDLHEHRGHLARHLSEDEHAQKELQMQEDDRAIVTSDHKMKTLACFFRENQRKWFGKRGTPMLGFMIATNPADEEEKAKGLKDVKFVMFLTHDMTQDDWAVACAKSHVCENELPTGTKKVSFVADGAGCFRSRLHRAIQSFWSHWTGMEEDNLRITPAGDGKSQLDGMFGQTNVVLSSAVDEGHSCCDPETILGAISESSGLTATVFKILDCDRENQITVSLAGGCSFGSSILTAMLDLRPDGQTSRACKHSGCGSGSRVDKNMFVFNEGEKEDKNKTFSFCNDQASICVVCMHASRWLTSSPG